jgi:hypothetical protein
MGANDGGSYLQTLDGMLQIAMADGGGSDDEGAIGNR